jgi:hypothetical protein
MERSLDDWTIIKGGLFKIGTFKDLTGQKFGKLTVIKRVEDKVYEKHKKSQFLCLCDCGNEIVVIGGKLTSGNTKSCGCLLKEVLMKRNYKHGNTTHTSRSRIYGIWSSMRSRCFNINDQNYFRYGERGIMVCNEWKNNFQLFYNWAINNGYQENLTLDRKNNNGNYEPDNCRWTTMKVQTNNTRKNIYIEINGITKHISEWVKETGLNYNTIITRMSKGETGERLIRPLDHPSYKTKKEVNS